MVTDHFKPTYSILGSLMTELLMMRIPETSKNLWGAALCEIFLASQLESRLALDGGVKGWPHIKAAARDAIAVSIGRGGRTFCNFVGRQQLVEGAPVSRVPMCGRKPAQVAKG